MEPVGLLLLFVCQVTTVYPDGIVLPVTSLSPKSFPTDQSKLTVKFTPNNDLPSYCTPANSQSIDRPLQTNVPYCTRPADITTVTLPQCGLSQPYSTAIVEPKIPIPSLVYPMLDNNPSLCMSEAQAQSQTVGTNVISAPTVNNPVQTLNPTFSQVPLTSSQNYLCNSENSIANSNIIQNDCVKSASPGVVPACSYFIVNNDATCGVTKTPLIPLKLDSIPSNIYRVKVNDAQPIVIDCTKSNCYTPPTPQLTPIVVKEQTEKPNVPRLLESNPAIEVRDNFVPPDFFPMNEFEEKTVASNPNILICDQNTNSILNNNDVKVTTESANKIGYPISNVVFHYGQNIDCQKQTANTETISCSSTTKSNSAAVDNDNVGLSITPLVSFVPNCAQVSPCNVQSSDYPNTDIDPKTIADQVCCKPAALPAMNSEAYLDIKEFTDSTQLPIVNKNKRLSPAIPPSVPTSYTPYIYANPSPLTQPCVYSSPNTQTVYKSTSDSFSSRLSCSLNSIISALTTGLVSTLYNCLGNTSCSSSVDKNTIPRVTPSETLSSDFRDCKESESRDIKTTITNISPSCLSVPASYYPTDPAAFNSLPPVISSACLPSSTIQTSKDNFLPTSVPSISSPAILLGPKIQTSSCFSQDELLKSSFCSKSCVNPKPYLSTITINLLPNDSTNDVIIVI